MVAIRFEAGHHKDPYNVLELEEQAVTVEVVLADAEVVAESELPDHSAHLAVEQFPYAQLGVRDVAGHSPTVRCDNPQSFG